MAMIFAALHGITAENMGAAVAASAASGGGERNPKGMSKRANEFINDFAATHHLRHIPDDKEFCPIQKTLMVAHCLFWVTRSLPLFLFRLNHFIVRVRRIRGWMQRKLRKRNMDVSSVYRNWIRIEENQRKALQNKLYKECHVHKDQTRLDLGLYAKLHTTEEDKQRVVMWLYAERRTLFRRAFHEWFVKQKSMTRERNRLHFECNRPDVAPSPEMQAKLAMLETELKKLLPMQPRFSFNVSSAPVPELLATFEKSKQPSYSVPPLVRAALAATASADPIVARRQAAAAVAAAVAEASSSSLQTVGSMRAMSPTNRAALRLNRPGSPTSRPPPLSEFEEQNKNDEAGETQNGPSPSSPTTGPSSSSPGGFQRNALARCSSLRAMSPTAKLKASTAPLPGTSPPAIVGTPSSPTIRPSNGVRSPPPITEAAGSDPFDTTAGSGSLSPTPLSPSPHLKRSNTSQSMISSPGMPPAPNATSPVKVPPPAFGRSPSSRFNFVESFQASPKNPSPLSSLMKRPGSPNMPSRSMLVTSPPLTSAIGGGSLNELSEIPVLNEKIGPSLASLSPKFGLKRSATEATMNTSGIKFLLNKSGGTGSGANSPARKPLTTPPGTGGSPSTGLGAGASSPPVPLTTGLSLTSMLSPNSLVPPPQSTFIPISAPAPNPTAELSMFPEGDVTAPKEPSADEQTKRKLYKTLPE